MAINPTSTLSSIPSAKAINSSAMLKLGSKGSQVVELQRALQKLGFYKAALGGNFGPATEAALKAFQQAAGIAVDGKAGAQTWGALKTRGAVGGTSPAPGTPAAPGAPAAPGTPAERDWKAIPTVKQGSSGDHVRMAQAFLKNHGYNPGPVDGQFGAQTQRAMSAFQKAKGLAGSGLVGPNTWKLLHQPGHVGVGPGPGAGVPASAGPVDPAPTGASPGIQAAIDFGLSQQGAPYVGGASPFRFGTPGNGKTYQMAGQKAYVSRAGVIGYDCSGFMVTMLKKAGINISHIANSRAMKATLPQVSKSALQPGDLLVKNGHVSMYIGNGQMIESGPSGVKVSAASRFINDPLYSGHRPG